jgi:hypothetical protein
MFAGQFGIVKEVLEQAIRRVTVKVLWSEHGVEQQVEVQEYLTDVRRVDQAIQVPNLAGLPGVGGAGGTGGTGTTGSGNSTPTGIGGGGGTANSVR